MNESCNGWTGREIDLAVAAGRTGVPVSLTLAEMSVWFDRHSAGAPAEATVTVTIEVSGTEREQAAQVAGIAGWLCAPVTNIGGAVRAVRRFGPSGQGVIEVRAAPAAAAGAAA